MQAPRFCSRRRTIRSSWSYITSCSRSPGSGLFGPRQSANTPIPGCRVDSWPSRISISFQIAAQFRAAHRVAQLAQRLGLDLADALAGECLVAPRGRYDLRRLVERVAPAVV